MGDVVQLNEYRGTSQGEPVTLVAESQVPIEFAVGNSDRQVCLQYLSDYGLNTIQTRRIRTEPEAVLHFISVKDAIWLNKRILEREDLSDEEIANHIDIIQMMENLDQHMMEALWASFTFSSES